MDDTSNAPCLTVDSYEESIRRLREAEYNLNTATAVYQEANIRLQEAWERVLQCEQMISRQQIGQA